MYVYIAWYCNM